MFVKSQKKKLSLIEDPNANHVRQMAAHFDANLDEGNDASTISMDNEKAKGFISSYRLFNGLTVWVYNITFHSDFKVELKQTQDSPLYFSYNVEGHFLHRFGKQNDFTKIMQNQNMIVMGGPETYVNIVFPAYVKLKLAVIMVDMTLLGNLNIRNAKRIYSTIGDIFQKIPNERPYRHLGGIDTETGEYASIVCENKGVDLIEELLTEGAVINMFASQIKAFSQDLTKNKSSLNKSELSKITSLGAYVIANLDTKLTVINLAKHLGMSPKKLQKGVKYLYGESVRHYISNLRMGRAKDLFITTDLNVSEVCHQIGLSSNSNFSKIFKCRYGMLPSKFLTSLQA